MNAVSRGVGVPRALIFRQRLFVPSETFITSQVEAMGRYAATYLTRGHVEHPRPAAETVSLSEHLSRRELVSFQMSARGAAVQRVVSEIGPNLIHAHFGPDGLYMARTAEKLGLPLFVTLHGRDVTVQLREHLTSLRPVATNYALRRRLLNRSATTLICVSQALADEAMKVGFDPDKVVVHYIGVDVDKFPAKTLPDEPRILFVGRLVEKKGLSDLVEAVGMIRDLPGLALTIVGDGPCRTALESRVAALGLANIVHFTGSMTPDGVREALYRAKVFAQPSVTAANGDQEGMPIALLEAMSTGRGVVGTDHAGIPEAIGHDGAGRLVGERSPRELAIALRDLLSDGGTAQEAGTNAAQRVRTRFNLTVQTRALERMYDAAG